MAKLTFSLQTSMNHFIVIFYFRRLFMSNPKLLLIAWELDLNAVSSSLGDKIVWGQRCKNPVILSLPFPPLVLQPPPPILPLSPPPRLLSNLTNYTAVTVWIAVLHVCERRRDLSGMHVRGGYHNLKREEACTSCTWKWRITNSPSASWTPGGPEKPGLPCK